MLLNIFVLVWMNHCKPGSTTVAGPTNIYLTNCDETLMICLMYVILYFKPILHVCY